MINRFVLRNVKRISEEEFDVVIESGKIHDITPPGHGQGQQIYDLKGTYISSGWIDLHVHAFPEFIPYGDKIDAIGVAQGVTTIVDAGSCGADRIEDLITASLSSKTNLFAFLNISQIGLKRVDELANLAWIDKQKVKDAVTIYRDKIVGLKARISKSVVGENGIKPLQIARQLSSETKLPLMIHIGSDPPAITDILPLLQSRDVLTHYLNGKSNNLFDEQGYPLPEVKDAIERGVHFDVGHGSASFSFSVAELARKHGISFRTISTDIYKNNRLHGPVYSLANVLTKFLYLGYSLVEIIHAVTIQAASWLNKPELGRIKVGDTANLTLFNVEDQPITLIDSEGNERQANKRIIPKGVVINGEFIACEVRT
ncbi:amidohydrolase/deacetylase family metallohydrolase [Gracilibacillus oryzae]|uniref:Amidohydrolase/deacetylase family metallohydrolase n=1 Tax=Gracilibacillus oryzae TaxID=1672701 RepID=A0A7C8KQC4_9BACI|nr:amidohydrolase/deacetylase family metallohydrolase [Gracilibacillus oryzae]KAB8127024.1 amidohydrolase/deacetylase family metallohydrolase [Gracilibacillus oryzae]